MPVKLSDFRKECKTTVVEFAGENVEVAYRLHAVTPGLLAKWGEAESKDSVMQQVETVVVRWDLVDDEGQEIGVTLENMQDIPLDFLNKVLREIVADIEGWNKEQKKSSGGGSLTTS